MYPGTGIKRNENPKEKASIFSKILFAYIVPIFKLARKGELEEKHVYNVIQSCKSNKLGDKFEKEWQKELKKPKQSLTKTLFRIFGVSYMWYGFLFCIVRVGNIVLKPLAVGKLVSYFSEDSKLSKLDAYYYAAIVITCTTITDVVFHYYHLNMSEIGLQIKVALCSMMYRKCLKLSTSSLIEVSTGRIVTMMAKDVQVFESAICFAHDVWIGLLQVSAMTYIMYQRIGVSVFIGVGFIIILIPVQIWIGVQTKNVRLKAAAKTDERLRRIQEILTSIKLIKLYTWVKYYTKLTNELRKYEMGKIKLIFYLKSVILTISALSQRVSLYLCLFSYSYIFQNTLTADTAFVIITCYSSMHFALVIAVPIFVFQFAEAKSSMKRIKQYLLIEDIKKESENLTDSNAKIISKAARVDFYDKTILKNINFKAKTSLIGITGPVGSGKSTFLKMIMQDIRLTRGNVSISGTISYASQEPWLFPATIKENILFGLPYDKDRYKTVIKVCGLNKDLQMFPLQDMTIVLDKGFNLSKGQQSRINLARAVYKKSDIYILDDVLTALDTSVSKFVFEECYKKFLKNKLILMVCHNKQFLNNSDRVLVFENGQIKFDNIYSILESMGIDFGTNKYEEPEKSKKLEESTKKQQNVNTNANEHCELLITADCQQTAAIYGETKVYGKVDISIYKKYLSKAGGWKLILILMLLYIMVQVLYIYLDFFIKNWLKMGEELSDIRSKMNEYTDNCTVQEKYKEVNEMYRQTMNKYTIAVIISTAFFASQYLMIFSLTSHASISLHNSVFSKITGACMSFYDYRLSGNILNRFSKDIGLIDEILPYTLSECICLILDILTIAAVILYINPILTMPTIIAFAIMLVVRKYYIILSMNLKRLESTTRAPVVGYLNTSLEGLTTIRATGNQQILIEQFDSHQDLNSSATYMYISTLRGFCLWLDILSCFYISSVILSFLVLFNKNLVAADVGIAITEAFGLSGILQWAFRQTAELENMMVSVERVVEYEDAKQEKLFGCSPNKWPIEGQIEFKNVNLYYNNSDNLVLNNINFLIKPNEKIGIIGRTGAGKSSIISVLFRLYDIEGSVIIDNIDIKDIELEIVRSKISLIPQDPVLFAGSIRSNLDPIGKYTDESLWKALEEVELKHLVENFELGLSSIVNEGGSNFSIGQRQLICLARAIIRNNKILVLDEATANIDPQTDTLIQKTIKRLFCDCTILTIAHRLNTVINSDKIMVVDFGSIVEFDAPQTLLDRQTGIFYSMVKQAGLIS